LTFVELSLSGFRFRALAVILKTMICFLFFILMKNKKHIMVFKRTGFIQSRDAMHCVSTKSRRDGTLLTVDFNLRKNQHDEYAAKSRRDDTLSSHCAVPAGLWIAQEVYPVRRLKSTVNKVPSLRDFALLKKYFYKFLISYI
jgi:hypothetical protein